MNSWKILTKPYKIHSKPNKVIDVECPVCEQVFTRQYSSVKNGHSNMCVSCNGKKRPANYRHGKDGSKVYLAWNAMRERCKNKNNPNYKNYGARGITYDERWELFDNFYEDMGEPAKGYTLERIDNERGYYKENCKWATWKEQANNTRRNRLVKYNGDKYTVSQLADKLGISWYQALKTGEDYE